MNALVGRSDAALRIALASLIAIIAGFWGLVSLFSDYPPDWPFARYALFVLGAHALAGVFIGMLLPLRWQFSLAASWGAILLGMIALVGILRSTGVESEAGVSFFSRFGSLLLVLAVPAVAAVGGYAGSRIVKKRSRGTP